MTSIFLQKVSKCLLNKLNLLTFEASEPVKIVAKLDYFINFGLPLFKINHLEWALITDSILIH